MDKLREEFEKYMKNNHPFINSKSDAYLAMWNIWQASSIPEGYVVVPKEMSDDLNDQLWDFMTDNFVRTNEDGDDFMECADFDLNMFYKAMIKAS